MRLFGYGAEKLVCGGKWRAVDTLGSGEIEVGFVDGNHFDNGREPGEYRRDAVAPLTVFFVMAVEKNSVRAEAPSGSERHCRVNTVFASFVAGGRNDAALVRSAADDHRFAAQFRAGEQLHRNEKRVHIHVQDGRVQRTVAFLDGIVLSAESSQVRHGLRLRLREKRYNPSAERTRGMPARSWATAMLAHAGVSKSG